ncbi:MAG: SpoIIE family protein phosphatase [Planctomycetota bacterium]
MHLVVSKHDSVVKALTFDTDVIGIGSDPDAQVFLPDGRIGPHQADLRAVEGAWVVEPLYQDHALILNAAVADEPTPIKNGDEIRLGDFVLKIFLDTESDTSQAPSAAAEEVAKLRQHALPPGSMIRKEEEITLRPVAKARIADFALQLSQYTDFSGLLHVSADALLKSFDARMVWLGIRRKNYGELEFVEGQRRDGKTATDPPCLATFLYRCLERNQFIVVPRTEEKETSSVLAIPLMTGLGCVGLVYLDSPNGAPPYDHLHLDELMMYGTLIAWQFEALLAGQLRQRSAVVSAELAFLRGIQARMDPAAVPQWDPLQLAVYCKPGLERSGDLFDVTRLPNGLASFLVAHVQASTLRVALAMAEVRTAFRMAAMHADPPHILLRALSWLVRTDRDPCLLHCAAVVMNPKTGACEYATAGDVGALIVNDTGEPRLLTDPAVKALGPGQDYALHARTERMAANETLVFYSPGCRTVCDRNGNRLGDGPLIGALCDGFGQSAAAALDELLSDLSAFFKEGNQADDITMVFVHRI